ncbi:hypothetical protein FFW70_20370 [Escherichia coli]|nr:hypothetical protein [Escherichia coli]EFD0544206.1 hypothetical protein [Escherichia coli]EFD0604991.1 hypothetical protein [Escherichia coli]EFN8241477.1 hypothetical protein [Escherichia coli]EFO2383893.1 hypothetical protein [Escherichia coli]
MLFLVAQGTCISKSRLQGEVIESLSKKHDVLDDLEDEKQPVDEKPYQQTLTRPSSLQDHS